MTQPAPLKISDASIEPTHSCFDDALDFFVQVVDLERVTRADLAHYRVVHGICSGVHVAQRYAHAWVEELAVEFTQGDGRKIAGEIVWQAGVIDGARVYFALERQWFYDSHRVEQVTRYTLEQSCELNASSGHYGPWRREYVELCRRNGDGKILGVVEGAAPLVVVRARV